MRTRKEPRSVDQFSIASDGDAKRRIALSNLCEKTRLQQSSPLFEKLSKLPLFDLNVGPREVVASFDPKHNGKRFRNLMKSKVRGIKVSEIAYNQHHFRYVLEKMGIPNADQLLEPQDPQNVAAMVKLLRILEEVVDFPFQDLNPIWSSQILEIKIICEISKRLSSFFWNDKASLTETATNFSCLSHLNFFLFIKNGTSFIPSQLFHDVQAMVKEFFFTPAKMQVYFPDRPFFTFQLGDDSLENFFGRLRTLTHDHSLDLVQFEERVQACLQTESIFSEHPEWSKPQKLTSSLDHWNTHSWQGDVSTKM
eukprot:Pompholyxophrys_punicea_v1_NODE_36_length_4801_cov_3.930257.p2 type:complete len:309 gc:universal NODE_36_length_4801_cov_3.930257:2265-3191(+)